MENFLCGVGTITLIAITMGIIIYVGINIIDDSEK